jgi:rubrerythrin
MNNQEAIEIIKTAIAQVEWDYPMDYAVAFDMAIKALEKQDVPETNVGKWTVERTQEHDGEWYCSECGYEPVVMSDDMKYCPGCGRKLSLPEPPKEE